MSLSKVKLLSSKIFSSTSTPDQLLSLILKNRHIVNPSDFFSPPHPKNLTCARLKISPTQVKSAITRINLAIKNQENILIYGDYDVDGLTSTALLWLALHSKAKITPFIPHRQKHGYGLKAAAVKDLEKQKKLNFSLIITVDNGITSATEIKKLSADIIVIDHHLPPAKKPAATAIIHSTLTSASTLAWFLARHFQPSAGLDLAALGLVADCQPLTGINRQFVSWGLKSFVSSPLPGLSSLIKVSHLDPQTLSTYHLSFTLAPRLNAVGRLADPMDALRLLCASSTRQASPLATKLNQLNLDRQQMQKKQLDIAKTAKLNPADKLIFISNSQFHPGIIGLIASHFSQYQYLPAVIISQGRQISKGSCRSIDSLNIISALRQFKDLFIDLGGHRLAAGFTISTKNIPILQRKLTKLVNKKLQLVDLSPKITVDALAKLSFLKINNIRPISRLQPFGLGNPQPLFLFKNLKVISHRPVGADSSHLKLKLDDPSTPRLEQVATDAIAFGQGHLAPRLAVGSLVDIVAALDINTWGGASTPQLLVKEIFEVPPPRW